MKREGTNQVFDQLRFRYPWRDYQAAALDDLQVHLADRRLHLVAPPGAGKTVLGIEVLRRLGEPTLIIVPTLSILTQWEISLRHDFGAGNAPWISRDLANPDLVTIVTYQSVYAAAKKSSVADLSATLARIGVKTVLMDEAHHLRNEWWRVLGDLMRQLALDHRIALTGTPPFDVDRTEWARYHELCGEIDVEITVPELVQSGDLCPHADFVWVEPPDPEVTAKILRHHETLTTFGSQLPLDEKLAAWARTQPALTAPHEHRNEIYANPRPLVATLALLAKRGEAVPAAALALFAAKANEIPAWSVEWAEVLINRFLTDQSDPDPHREVRLTLSRQLRHLGALQRGKVRLSTSAELDREITSSAGKLKGVKRIVTTTLDRSGTAARIVVLSSTINREVLDHAGSEDAGANDLTKLGVAPCFEILRRAGVRSLALLTGALLVIPERARADLIQLYQQSHPQEAPLEFRALGNDENFVQFNVPDRLRHRVVAWTTELFTLGRIQVLCGTQSLLGEGWDAPCINCLIIASNSGSFMFSNQIRGRAVRSDRQVPEKTSAIWHLATATTIPSHEPDFDTLDRRFDMFVGPHIDEPVIVSGLDRVGDILALNAKSFTAYNEGQLEKAGDAEWIRARWQEPASEGSARPPRMRREVRVNRPVDPKFFSTFAIESILRLTVGSTLFGMIESFAQSVRGLRSSEELTWRLTAWVIFCLLAFGPTNAKALWLILRFGRTSPATRILGETCHRHLFPPEKALHTGDPLNLQLEQTDYGVSFALSGGHRTERLRLSAALRECFGPIDSPRFLVRIARSVAWIPIRTPLYFPLPSSIRKREDASQFVARVKRELGRATLVDCRTVDGRAELLRARKADLFRSINSDPPRELSKWE